MKEKILVLCLFGFLVVWCGWPKPGLAQDPVPDIKANGYDTPLNLVPPLDLSLTLSLTSGGLTDPADWWLVVVWPQGAASLTSEGWKPGLHPAYTGPLFDFSRIDLAFPSAVVPPMIPFQIFLAVDLPGNGVLDLGRLYWDMVTFTKSETSGEEVPGEEIGKALFPAYMYYLDRVLSGLPSESEIEEDIAMSLEASPDTVPLLNELLSRYRELPKETKLQLFDPQIVQLTLDPSISFDFEALRNRVAALDPDLMITEFDTPTAPSGLTATNTSLPGVDPDTGESVYRISLSWQDNAANEDGFLIYRLCYPSVLGTPYQQIAQTGANVTSYEDQSLSAPTIEAAECCYQVTAFKTSRFSLIGQPPAKLESAPASNACSNYAPNAAQVFIDSDNDGVPDDLDECPLDHAEGAPWTNGCPDDDDDGVPNKDDACKLVWGEKENGCPLKYQIRWMGMDVLNNSGAYAWSGYTFQGLSGSLFNEVDPYAGEEPYLVFAFVNGITAKGAKESGANTWCCGEDVIVPKTGPPVDSDNDGYTDNHEPDSVPGVPVLGTTIFENQDLLDHGFTAFPAFASDYSEIDSKHGLVLTVSLMERDWTMTFTPDSQASAVDVAIAAGGLAGSVASCVGSAGLGCLLSIGGGMKKIIESILDLSNKPDPITVTDPDDPMGTSIWAITRSDAAFKTSDNGTYGFWFPVPTTYQKSCLGWEPCGAGQGVAITMRANAHFCLVREDVPEAEVKSRCGALSTYSQVLPWPMTASSP
jgi:hypothetical protein